MKSFLEEYGFAILAAIVVILLIAMATPVGNLIKGQILGVVESFGSSANNKLSSIDAGDAISLSVKQATQKNAFLYVATSDSSADTFKLQYRVKNSGGWSNYEDVTGYTAITGDGVQKELAAGPDALIKCDNGNTVEFQMVDTHTGLVYGAPAIVFTAYAAAAE